MTPLRQGVRYQRLQEAENDEQEEVTVHLYSRSSRPVVLSRSRDAALRICSSLLLLVVAIGFVLYELEYEGGLDPPWNISTFSAAIKTHDTHHHHPAEEEDHRHLVGTYHQAAAFTDSECCSEVARDIMESGGSVVDAGVAAVLCLAVVHPHSVSLGGIFSSIYFNGITQNASVLNAIPHEASPFPYGIPALLQGLWQLHLRHGRKQWSDLFSPAIHLALEGFLVDSSLHTALQENQVKVMSSEGLHALFYDQNILKRVGASVRNLQLGHILEHARTMTDSSLPRELIQKLSGDMKIADREIFTETLSKVLLNREDLVQLHIDGLTLYSSSTPTAGSILINAFQEVYGRHGVNASVSISDLLINVSKTVYTMTGVWPPHITANQSARLPDLSPVGSNVLVADSDGDVVVISLTLNSTFGSGFVCPSTGILLSDFVEGSAPLSFWACPSVLLFGDDNHIMGLASRGGSSIPYTLARVLLHHVLLQMDLTESVNGTVAHLGPGNSDPWSKYLGLDSSAPEMVMAVEVQAEHVHVASGRDCSCYPAGL